MFKGDTIIAKTVMMAWTLITTGMVACAGHHAEHFTCPSSFHLPADPVMVTDKKRKPREVSFSPKTHWLVDTGGGASTQEA